MRCAALNDCRAVDWERAGQLSAAVVLSITVGWAASWVAPKLNVNATIGGVAGFSTTLLFSTAGIFSVNRQPKAPEPVPPPPVQPIPEPTIEQVELMVYGQTLTAQVQGRGSTLDAAFEAITNSYVVGPLWCPKDVNPTDFREQLFLTDLRRDGILIGGAMVFDSQSLEHQWKIAGYPRESLEVVSKICWQHIPNGAFCVWTHLYWIEQDITRSYVPSTLDSGLNQRWRVDLVDGELVFSGRQVRWLQEGTQLAWHFAIDYKVVGEMVTVTVSRPYKDHATLIEGEYDPGEPTELLDCSDMVTLADFSAAYVCKITPWTSRPFAGPINDDQVLDAVGRLYSYPEVEKVGEVYRVGDVGFVKAEVRGGCQLAISSLAKKPEGPFIFSILR